MPTRAPQIPKHLWPQMVMAVIASGLATSTWGKANGLTQPQCNRLQVKVKAALKKQSESFSITDEPDQQRVIKLQSRLRAGMLGTAEVASRLLHRFNLEYAETVDEKTGKPVQPVPEKGTLSAWKWAWSVGANVLALTRRNGDQPPADPAPPVREAMQQTPRGLVKRIRTVEVTAIDTSKEEGA